jgi:hypothetical protein
MALTTTPAAAISNQSDRNQQNYGTDGGVDDQSDGSNTEMHV